MIICKDRSLNGISSVVTQLCTGGWRCNLTTFLLSSSGRSRSIMWREARRGLRNKRERDQIRTSLQAVKPDHSCGVMTIFFFQYSGGQMKFNSNNISFNFSGYTKIIKKCNIPLKSPIKWLPRMQKKIWNFQLLISF